MQKLVWNSFAQGTRNLAIVYSQIRGLREAVCRKRYPQQHTPVLEGYRRNAQKSAHVFLNASLRSAPGENPSQAIRLRAAEEFAGTLKNVFEQKSSHSRL